MNDPRVEKLAVSLAAQAEIEVDEEVEQECAGLIAMFENAELTVIDANDPATVQRVARVITIALRHDEPSPDGLARAVLAALAMPRDGAQ